MSADRFRSIIQSGLMPEIIFHLKGGTISMNELPEFNGWQGVRALGAGRCGETYEIVRDDGFAAPRGEGGAGAARKGGIEGSAGRGRVQVGRALRGGRQEMGGREELRDEKGH